MPETKSKRRFYYSFPRYNLLIHSQESKFPLLFAAMEDRVDVECNIEGGGPSGQAGAIRWGIAWGLRSFVDKSMIDSMQVAGLLTRDPRTREPSDYVWWQFFKKTVKEVGKHKIFLISIKYSLWGSVPTVGSPDQTRCMEDGVNKYICNTNDQVLETIGAYKTNLHAEYINTKT
ncbi:unnamed protein product [Leptidea sinapis]|uniref:Uncharacterized protein n=1 Tax=Leptidea sinapis TaxID=189913 RepID=A0A5E4QU46_9NEOP|nr:unnamed protein product [Leptidea sinapis]